MARLTQSQLITQRLTPRIRFFQSLEAFNHTGRHISSTVVQFPYENWLSTPAAVYRKNGTIVTPASTDLTLGTATISSLDAGDEITADYSFQYFTTDDLEDFFDLALSKLNNTPPASAFTYGDYSTDFEDFLTSYAYLLCIERILLDMSTWKARLIWADPQSTASNLLSVLSSTKSDFTATLRGVKGRRFLPARSISVARWKVPSLINGHNFQNFTTISSG